MSMNRLIAAACVASLAASSAMAQSGTPPTNEPRSLKPAQSTTTMKSGSAFLTQQAPGDMLTESYAGSEVMVHDGDRLESVGEVSHAIVDEQQKTIGALVKVGGFLGIGERTVGIDWSHLERVNAEDGTAFVLSGITEQQLEDAPTYVMMRQDEPPAPTGGNATTAPDMTPTPKSKVE